MRKIKYFEIFYVFYKICHLINFTHHLTNDWRLPISIKYKCLKFNSNA